MPKATCPNCGGTGTWSGPYGAPVYCKPCNGTGQVQTEEAPS